MDIPLIRTFLEVNRTRHFSRAADGLFITQAAVSARIAQLEERVGSPLFFRERNKIELTIAGQRLLTHAELLMGAWNRLLLQTSGVASGKQVLALGCLPSISEVFIERWLPHLHEAMPQTLLQVETLNSEDLIARVRTRSLDAGLLYEPLRAPQMEAERLTQMELVLVATEPVVDLEGVRYIQLDWGNAYDVQRLAPWEQQVRVALRVDSPRLARYLLLLGGGAATLPRSLVSEDLKLGRLQQLTFAAPLVREVYLLQHTQLQEDNNGLNLFGAFNAALAGSS